jgi:hypothetical protein
MRVLIFVEGWMLLGGGSLKDCNLEGELNVPGPQARELLGSSLNSGGLVVLGSRVPGFPVSKT